MGTAVAHCRAGALMDEPSVVDAAVESGIDAWFEGLNKDTRKRLSDHDYDALQSIVLGSLQLASATSDNDNRPSFLDAWSHIDGALDIVPVTGSVDAAVLMRARMVVRDWVAALRYAGGDR